jgi:secreted Zn-dependent insulinase-like peptidase
VLSRFFIDPLIDPVYVDKEIQAVHSEFEGTFNDEERHFRLL